MDYEGLRQFASSPEGVYVGFGLAGIVAGYAMNSLLGGRKVRIAEARRDQAKYEAESARTSLEERRVEVADADAQHQRELGIIKEKRSYQLADEERRGKEAKDEADAREQQEGIKQKRTLELAKELAVFEPALREYLARGNTDYEDDKACLKKRRELRGRLVGMVLEYHNKDHESNEWTAGRIMEGGREIIGRKGMAKINRLVEATYPLSEGQRVPAEIGVLIRAVLGDGYLDGNTESEVNPPTAEDGDEEKDN